ncbi:MAG: hypothetical protein FJ264_16110, partial [Planctomycetes bacterium]|nr:hypothetical protein [Planctomycetota bacterium]
MSEGIFLLTTMTIVLKVDSLRLIYKAPLSMTCFFIDNIYGHPEPFAYVMLSGVEASFTAQDKLR